VVDQARALGTREWAISGGEPMLRADFAEIFDYVTAKATTYSLNTNGTLITPEIAQLMKRKGSKMVAVYGATAAVYDEVTCNPGGFAALMEGFARLKEAGAGFTVQLIPMKGNWHEWEAMQELAKSLSKHWRVGAPWLYLSACGGAARNAEIEAQRLDPADAVALDEPDLSGEDPLAARGPAAALAPPLALAHGGAAEAGTPEAAGKAAGLKFKEINQRAIFSGRAVTNLVAAVRKLEHLKGVERRRKLDEIYHKNETATRIVKGHFGSLKKLAAQAGIDLRVVSSAAYRDEEDVRHDLDLLENSGARLDLPTLYRDHKRLYNVIKSTGWGADRIKPGLQAPHCSPPGVPR
jgi:hypothetical protein